MTEKMPVKYCVMQDIVFLRYTSRQNRVLPAAAFLRFLFGCPSRRSLLPPCAIVPEDASLICAVIS